MKHLINISGNTAVKYAAALLIPVLLIMVFHEQANAQQIKPVAPIPGQQVTGGSRAVIKWEAEGIAGEVRLSLWDGISQTWREISTGTEAAAGTLQWMVPNDLSGDLFRIKIESVGNPEVAAFTEAYFVIAGGENGSDRTTEATDHSDGQSASQISVQPNPATDEVLVQFTGNTPHELRLVNMVGETVRMLHPTSTSASAARIGTGDLPGGTYFLKAIYADGTESVTTIVISK